MGDMRILERQFAEMERVRELRKVPDSVRQLQEFADQCGRLSPVDPFKTEREALESATQWRQFFDRIPK